MVEVKGAFVAAGKLCVGLEMCSFGEIGSFVNKTFLAFEDISLNESDLVLLTIGKDILSGLDFLRTISNVIHGD